MGPVPWPAGHTTARTADTESSAPKWTTDNTEESLAQRKETGDPTKKGGNKKGPKEKLVSPVASLLSHTYYRVLPPCKLVLYSALWRKNTQRGGWPAVPTKPSVALGGPQWPTTASEGSNQGVACTHEIGPAAHLMAVRGHPMCSMRCMNPGPSGSGSGQQPSIHPSIHPSVYSVCRS